MIIEAMKSYRVIVGNDSPKRAGQTALRDYFQFTEGEKVLKLPWGTVVEAREQCQYPFEFSTSEQKYLVHIEFIRSHKNLFNSI